MLLSYQPKVMVTSCIVYKGIRDIYSIDHPCIYPIRRIGLIHSEQSIRVSANGVYKLMFYFTIVNKKYATVTLGWHDSRVFNSYLHFISVHRDRFHLIKECRTWL